MASELRKIADAVMPWTFDVDDGSGRIFPTRAPSIGELSLLAALDRLSNDDGTAFVLSLFSGDEKPDVKQWPADNVQAFLAGYYAHFKEHTRKNSQAIADRAMAMVTAMSSTPRI